MLSGPVTGSTRATLQSIIQTSGGLQYVVLVTNCHPSLQTWAQVWLKSFLFAPIKYIRSFIAYSKWSIHDMTAAA